MRKWIIPLAVLMVVPALGAAAPIVVPPVDEQLVEGHTVFTVIEQYTPAVCPQCPPQADMNRTQYAAAVAVLVREKVEYYDSGCGYGSERFNFPGVLWFNDQYLVNPNDASSGGSADCVPKYNYRYPCTGAVLAVNDLAASPLGVFDPTGADITNVLEYNESYLITDPNDHIWIVDKWNRSSDGGVTWGNSIWTVAMKNNDVGRNTADDGTSNCAPYYESSYVPAGNDLCTGPSDYNGLPPRCNDETYIDTTGTATSYNAVLFFFLDDLTAPGLDKDHAVASTDVSGCQPGTEWVCPAGDDNAEGNSHPYNPCDMVVYDTLDVCYGAGAGNHGGSGDSGAQGDHATRNVDIYYGTAPIPIGSLDPLDIGLGLEDDTAILGRNYVLTDIQGSSAPFHCHEPDTCYAADLNNYGGEGSYSGY